MVICLTSARFNMKADVLRQGAEVSDDPATDEIEEGRWVSAQDPDSGEIIRVWQKNPEKDPTPDPDAKALESFKCIARGIVDGGIRVAGTTERFGEMYSNIDYIKITFPAHVKISKRDRITNVRDAAGNIIWREEEVKGSPPTVFNVNGVTPILDPFGRHIESFALCERAERQ